MNQSSLKIFQWNCHSLRNKLPILRDIIDEYDILTLQETWLDEFSYTKIPNYSVIRKDRKNSTHGGVAILIKNNIPFRIMENIFYCEKSLETVAITIPYQINNNNKDESLLIVSLYRNPSKVTTTNEWTQLFNSIKDYKNIILTGDFNIHHYSWGANKTCPSGESLVETLSDYNLYILNDGSHTYFSTKTTVASDGSEIQTMISSALDLTLTSANFLHKTTWMVYEDNLQSDHFPIVTTISLEIEKLPFNSTHKINCNKINWELYNVSIKTYIEENQQLIKNMSTDEKYSILNKLCIAAAVKQNKKSMNQSNIHDELQNTLLLEPLTDNEINWEKTFKIKPTKAPWWNEDCINLTKERRTASRNLLTNPSYENLKILKQTENTVKKKLKKIKKNSFRKHIADNLTPDTDTKTVWNIINSFKNIRNTAPVFSNNDIEIIENTKKFIKEFCNQADSTPQQYSLETDKTPYLELDKPFTKAELEMAIKESKTQSSPGLDQIEYKMIKNTPDTFKEILLNIINEYFSSGNNPAMWKKFLIILIPKGNKNKFRPISLASCILKLKEKMLNTRLHYYAEKYDLIPNTQNGFRKAKSCYHAIAYFLTDIYLSMHNNLYVLCSLIDIKSAFDCVCPIMLDKILTELNIPIKTRTFIFQLIAGKELYFKVGNNLEGPYTKNNGVPQGSVLSPILYNIYVRLLKKILPEDIQLVQYADDNLIYIIHHDIQTGINKLQDALKSLNTYLANLKLQISGEKTKFIIFSNSAMKTNLTHSIQFNDTIINECSSVKYLGMIMDNTLTWKEHAQHIIAKATNQLNILKFLCGTWWGGHPQILKQIYISLIRSSLEYGLFLTYIKDSKLRTKIQKIQNQAIRIALGYRRSTPINVLHSESKIDYFYDRIQYLSNKFMLKLLAHESPLLSKLEILSSTIKNGDRLNIKYNFPIIKSYIEIKALLQTKVQKHLHPIPFDYQYDSIMIEPNINIEVGSTIKKASNPSEKFEKIFSRRITNTYTIFTDASKIQDQNHTGLAIYIPSNNQSHMYKISSDASIYTAEGLAIFLAISMVKNSNQDKALIFSDSRSILMALKEYTPNKSRNTSHIILDIKLILYECLENSIEITLVWIPAHCGITHNEKVDTLAKKACTEGTNIIYLLPYSDFTQTITNKLKDKTNQLLTDQGISKGSLFFNNYHEHSQTKSWFSRVNLSREHITTINRIRSNHYNLASSLYRKNMCQTPTCECGHESEDIDHILWECPRFSVQRVSLLNKLNHYYNKKKKQTPKDTITLLKKPKDTPARIITEFIAKCNLQI